MIPKMEKQANLTNIAAGAVCTTALPARGVHHGLYLMCRKAAAAPMSRAEIIADIGTIVLRLGGDIKIEASATVLLDLFKYWHDKDGAFTVAGLIPIPFTRPNLLSAAERSLLAWGMKDTKQKGGGYTAEVNITAVATLVTIEVWCAIEDAERNLGRHLCIGYHPQNFGSTGVQELTTLPFGDPDVGILAVHIGESTGDINSVSAKVSRPRQHAEIFDEIPMEMNNHLSRKAGRTAQTDYYHVDYSLINDKTGYLPSGPITAQKYDIEWEAGGGAPGNYPIHIEEVRGLLSKVV